MAHTVVWQRSPLHPSAGDGFSGIGHRSLIPLPAFMGQVELQEGAFAQL